MAGFVITGEMITERAREMWSDRKYSEAYAFLSESVPGMSRDQQTAVLSTKEHAHRHGMKKNK